MDERTRINAQLTKELKVKSFRILHRLDQASENAVNVNQSLLMRIVKDNQDSGIDRLQKGGWNDPKQEHFKHCKKCGEDYHKYHRQHR